MRLLHAAVGVACLCLCSTPVCAQRYGEWDRPCTLQLPPRFSWPFASGVIYGGHEWVTEWRSISQVAPLPSYNWYEATPDPDPVSTDDGARWIEARVEGHCTIEQNPYYITYHTYPVAFGGRVVTCPSGGGGGGVWEVQYITEPGDPSYDPYSSYGGMNVCSQGPHTGGDAGGDLCHQEYVYIDISYDGGSTWSELWEGWATVCG